MSGSFEVVAIHNNTLNTVLGFIDIIPTAAWTLVLLPDQASHTQGTVHPAGSD
jgi:hypothetical protein